MLAANRFCLVPSMGRIRTDAAEGLTSEVVRKAAQPRHSQVAQYQRQYKDTVAKAKEQAKQAADATAKTLSRGALFGALALMLGALAAFFAGKASAVNAPRSRDLADRMAARRQQAKAFLDRSWKLFG